MGISTGSVQKAVVSAKYALCCNDIKVTLPTGVDKIDEFVFDNDCTIYVPYGKVDYYKERIVASCWDCIVELPKGK